jgi:hypothetical protein
MPLDSWVYHKGCSWLHLERRWNLASGKNPTSRCRPHFVFPNLVPSDSCLAFLLLPFVLGCAAGHFAAKLYNGGKPGGAPIAPCISTFLAGGGITGDPFSALISFLCTCRSTIRCHRLEQQCCITR